MKSTRVTLGIVVSLLAWTGLYALWAVRYDFEWHSLGKWYREASKEDAYVGLPLVTRLLWPFAPAAWWGWMSPIGFGIFSAFSVRNPLRYFDQLAALGGTLILAAAILGTIVSYTGITFYDYASLVDAPIETAQFWGNTGLLLVSTVFATLAAFRYKAQCVNKHVNKQTDRL